MKKIALAATTAAAIISISVAGAVAAKAEQLKMAQGVDVQIGHDRQDNGRRDQQDNGRRDQQDNGRRDQNPGFSVGVGPNGISVGPKRRCHTVTIIEERPDGRRVRTTERRCD